MIMMFRPLWSPYRPWLQNNKIISSGRTTTFLQLRDIIFLQLNSCIELHLLTWKNALFSANLSKFMRKFISEKITLKSFLKKQMKKIKSACFQMIKRIFQRMSTLERSLKNPFARLPEFWKRCWPLKDLKKNYWKLRKSKNKSHR